MFCIECIEDYKHKVQRTIFWRFKNKPSDQPNIRWSNCGPEIFGTASEKYLVQLYKWFNENKNKF